MHRSNRLQVKSKMQKIGFNLDPAEVTPFLNESNA
jgi:hypothetical protein